MTDNPVPRKPVNKKLLLGGGAAVTVVGYIWYKRKAAASAATATTADNSGNTTDTSEDAIDPATGMPYSEEGTAVGSPYGQLSGLTYNPATGTYTSTSQTSSSPVDNSQWVQNAQAYLTGLGEDSTSVADALGAYVTGGTLSSDQQSIVQAALGAIGNPPSPVTNASYASNTGQSGASGSSATSSWLHPPTGATYVRNSSTGEIDQVWPDGTTIHLSPFQYAALGSPASQGYSGPKTIVGVTVPNTTTGPGAPTPTVTTGMKSIRPIPA